MAVSNRRLTPKRSGTTGLSRMLLVTLAITVCVISVTGSSSYAASFPSPWAEDEIGQAVVAGLIPADMLGDYTKPITRAELCRLLIIVMEKAAGTSIEEWTRACLQRTDVDFTVSPFSDTSDRSVLAASYLNIMQGRDEHHFDPDGCMTREEAARSLSATFLYWYAVSLPYGPGEPYTDFGEIDRSAQWDVASLKRAGIMIGVGDGLFDPRGVFTREQAYVTMVRLRNSLPYPLPSSSTAPALAHPQVRVYLEDTQAEFEGSIPYGCSLVPSRYISEALGAQVDYDEVTGRIAITKGDNEILLYLASREACVNGETVALGLSPKLVEDDLMLPFWFICQALDAWVEWWHEDLCVRVYSSPPTAAHGQSDVCR